VSLLKRSPGAQSTRGIPGGRALANAPTMVAEVSGSVRIPWISTGSHPQLLSYWLVCCCLAIFPPPADGQQENASPEAIGSSAEDLVSKLEYGSWLRVRWEPGRASKGEFLGLRDGAVTLRGGPRVVEFPVGAVDSIWIGHSTTGRGALIGGLSGATVGILLALLAERGTCDGNCTAGLPGTIWAGMIFGGVGLGAGIGAFVGSQTLTWRLVFPASATGNSRRNAEQRPTRRD